jgi:hypothetical protein
MHPVITGTDATNDTASTDRTKRIMRARQSKPHAVATHWNNYSIVWLIAAPAARPVAGQVASPLQN